MKYLIFNHKVTKECFKKPIKRSSQRRKSKDFSKLRGLLKSRSKTFHQFHFVSLWFEILYTSSLPPCMKQIYNKKSLSKNLKDFNYH